MFTLKIKWVRYERENGVDGIVDESTLFIEANQITTHALVKDHRTEMESWSESDFFNYQVEIPTGSDEKKFQEARVIQVDRDSKPTTWYLASNAWLLGPDGKTIERLI